MKKTLFILIALTLSLSSRAQQKPQPSKEERVKHFSQTLSVDKKKAEEIVAALDFNVEKMRSTIRDTSIAPQVKRELMKKLHEERQAKLKATLTPQQCSLRCWKPK
jgi:hypothetical protein